MSMPFTQSKINHKQISENQQFPMALPISEPQSFPIAHQFLGSSIIKNQPMPETDTISKNQQMTVDLKFPLAQTISIPQLDDPQMAQDKRMSVLQPISDTKLFPEIKQVLETSTFPSTTQPVSGVEPTLVPRAVPSESQQICASPPLIETLTFSMAKSISISRNILETESILETKSDSVVYPVLLSNSKNKPLEISQPMSEVKQITQPLAELQSSSDAQPLQVAEKFPVAGQMSLTNLENQLMPLAQPNSMVLQPIFEAVAVVNPSISVSHPILKAESNLETKPNLVTHMQNSMFNEIHPILEDQQMSSPMPLNRSLFKPLLLPVSHSENQMTLVDPLIMGAQQLDRQLAMQVPKFNQPISEGQPKQVHQPIWKMEPEVQTNSEAESITKTFLKTRFKVPNYRCNYQIRRPSPFRRVNKFRAPSQYPAKADPASAQPSTKTKQMSHIILNFIKIKKITLMKVSVYTIGTFLLLFAVWGVWRFHASIEDLSPKTCSKYFQYLSRDGTFFGKMTLSNLPEEAIHVNLKMQQQPFLNNGYVGNLTLYEDLEKTENCFKNHKTITYRVSFLHNIEQPKVLSVTVNGIQICSDTNYTEHGTEVVLAHTFYPSEIPVTERKRRPFIKDFPDIKYKFGAHAEAQEATEATSAITTTTQLISVQSRFAPPNTNCGRVYTGTIIPLIFGGTELRRGQFPWLVAIYRKHYTGLQFICGGSLISSRTVLTAGHCFKLYNLKAEQIVIFLGRHNLENYGEDGIIPREIEKLVIHSDYNSELYSDADLALMQMRVPVSFNKYIQPICLWDGPDDETLVSGLTGVVAGWGADENGRAVSPIPKMVSTSIASEAECLRSSEVFSKVTSKRTICAGNRDGTGPCMGDSGGGLMIKRDGRWMIRGIVSLGLTRHQSCNLNEFVIYCDIAKHKTWLESNLLY